MHEAMCNKERTNTIDAGVRKENNISFFRVNVFCRTTVLSLIRSKHIWKQKGHETDVMGGSFGTNIRVILQSEACFGRKMLCLTDTRHRLLARRTSCRGLCNGGKRPCIKCCSCRIIDNGYKSVSPPDEQGSNSMLVFTANSPLLSAWGFNSSCCQVMARFFCCHLSVCLGGQVMRRL